MFLLVFVSVIVYIIIDRSNNNRDREYNEYQEKPPSLPKSKIGKRHDEGEPKKLEKAKESRIDRIIEQKKLLGQQNCGKNRDGWQPKQGKNLKYPTINRRE